MSDTIQFRRGTSAEWAAANPILAAGEPGFDTTTGDYKIGDGVTRWATLLARYVPVPTAWVYVSVFTNSWVNFGGGEQVARYRKIGDTVYVEGLVKSGTVATAMFTLPAGFQPPANLYFASNANDLFGAFSITSAGVVGQRAGSNTFFSVNCSFATV